MTAVRFLAQITAVLMGLHQQRARAFKKVAKTCQNLTLLVVVYRLEKKERF
jgi:hypothetical protein